MTADDLVVLRPQGLLGRRGEPARLRRQVRHQQDLVTHVKDARQVGVARGDPAAGAASHAVEGPARPHHAPLRGVQHGRASFGGISGVKGVVIH